MQYPKVIADALDYIEQNLKAEITAEELAERANYSTYHYLRLFSSAMGSSVAGYILKRRLDHALAEIADGRKAIEVVIEYGFDTYAGFYKAFVKMYGCSPKKYLKIYQKHKAIKPEVVNMHIYSKNELRKVLLNWDIPEQLPIGDCYVVNGEKTDDTKWTVGGDYILKTGERVKRIKHLNVAKALGKQGFSAATPIKTKDGEEFLDGDDIFILSYAVKGAPLGAEELYGECRSRCAEEAGIGIAKLHRALKAVQKDFSPDNVNLYSSAAQWALPKVKQQNLQWNMGIADDFFEDYTESFGKLCDRLPKQLIHRNPCPSNVLFEDGKVSGFEDFDLSECNVRLWDPCYFATGILSEGTERMYDIWMEILKSVLHGYNRENPLSADEKQAVFYVICSIQMICVAYFAGMEEYQALAKTNRRMLRFIIDNKEQINGIF